MPQQNINIGASANDGTGDPLRSAFVKVNANFNEVYGFRGNANGLASLDAMIKIPVGQIPNDFGGNILRNAVPPVSVQTASYTLANSDKGGVLRMNAITALNVTLPNNWDIGQAIEVSQAGLGQVTFVPASGASLVHADSHTRIRRQHSVVMLRVTENTGGTSAQWRLSGDTAP